MRAAVAGAVLATLLAVGPAVAAEAAAPAGLSVSIRAGNSEVRSGDRLAYTATVTNEGTSTVEGRLVITVPDFVRVVDAEGSDRSGADTSWAVTVPAGGSVSKKLIGVVDRIPEGQLRVTTLASLYLGDAPQPTIRSADAAAIEGVKDPAHAVGDQPAKPAAAPVPIIWICLGLVAVGAIATISARQFFLRRRRQGRLAHSGSPASR